MPPHRPAGTPERGVSTPGKGPGTVEALSEAAPTGGNVTVGGPGAGAGVLLGVQEDPPPGEPVLLTECRHPQETLLMDCFRVRLSSSCHSLYLPLSELVGLVSRANDVFM